MHEFLLLVKVTSIHPCSSFSSDILVRKRIVAFRLNAHRANMLSSCDIQFSRSSLKRKRTKRTPREKDILASFDGRNRPLKPIEAICQETPGAIVVLVVLVVPVVPAVLAALVVGVCVRNEWPTNHVRKKCSLLWANFADLYSAIFLWLTTAS